VQVCSHWQSITSDLRPDTFWTCRGFTKHTAIFASSSSSAKGSNTHWSPPWRRSDLQSTNHATSWRNSSVKC